MAGRKVREPIVPTIWPEERIREELRRLDKKTGLHGADLTIVYDSKTKLLGAYHPLEKKFRFSTKYFENPSWSEQSAIDVIRHEYAHFMDHMLNDSIKPPHHGPKWKACCRAIGTPPERLYSEEREKKYKKKNIEEASTAICYGTYEVGKSIVHPAFGRGMIIEANGEGLYRIVTVMFPAVGVKRLGVSWVDKNCTRV